MGTPSLASSSSSSIYLSKSTSKFLQPSLPFRCPLKFSRFVSLSHSSKPLASSSSSSSVSAFSVLNEDPFTATMPAEEPIGEDSLYDGSVSKNLLRPCELYVCNLPRSCGIAELLDIFKPYGTVQSIEVSRDAETGISRGSGCVTMSSVDQGKAAIASLDGSDVGGREMRVRFSAEMNTETGYYQPLSSKPKNFVFESPYKIYVGNLAWRVKPEDLKNLFSRFGMVQSARVLHDSKGGKNRVYGFVSFASPSECDAAVSANGAEFLGRKLVIRHVPMNNEPRLEL